MIPFDKTAYHYITPNEQLISDLMVLCNQLNLRNSFTATRSSITYTVKMISLNCKKVKFTVRDRTPTKVQLAIDIVKASKQNEKLAQVEKLIRMGFLTKAAWDAQDYELVDVLDVAEEMKIPYES